MSTSCCINYPLYVKYKTRGLQLPVWKLWFDSVGYQTKTIQILSDCECSTTRLPVLVNELNSYFSPLYCMFLISCSFFCSSAALRSNSWQYKRYSYGGEHKTVPNHVFFKYRRSQSSFFLNIASSVNVREQLWLKTKHFYGMDFQFPNYDQMSTIEINFEIDPSNLHGYKFYPWL